MTEEMLRNAIEKDSRKLLSAFDRIVEYLSDSSMGECWNDEISEDINFVNHKLNSWAYENKKTLKGYNVNSRTYGCSKKISRVNKVVGATINKNFGRMI